MHETETDVVEAGVDRVALLDRSRELAEIPVDGEAGARTVDKRTIAARFGPRIAKPSR